MSGQPRRQVRHPSQGPLLTIDLDAIAANTRRFADRARGQLMAVVKADGFGHGAADVARTALANGATWFGVTSVDEALVLRDAGIHAHILSWLNPVAADFETAVRNRIDIAVPSSAHLDAVAAAAVRAGQPARVHLHIDLGMARDGVEPRRWTDVCRQARSLERRGVLTVVGVMGHLGWADEPADPCNAAARRAFTTAVTDARRHGLRPSLRHLAATSATLTDLRSHFDLCRVGAGIVGIDPSGTTSLRPAMTLTAPVTSVRAVPRGTSVGYGHTYRTPRATRLALLGVGYADGIPRAASGRAWVCLAGRRRPVVGLVSMDQIVVDIGSDAVHPGDVAVVFGIRENEPTVAEWATWSGTIEHEIVTGIGRRVTRRVRAADGADRVESVRRDGHSESGRGGGGLSIRSDAAGASAGLDRAWARRARRVVPRSLTSAGHRGDAA